MYCAVSEENNIALTKVSWLTKADTKRVLVAPGSSPIRDIDILKGTRSLYILKWVRFLEGAEVNTSFNHDLPQSSWSSARLQQTHNLEIAKFALPRYDK